MEGGEAEAKKKEEDDSDTEFLNKEVLQQAEIKKLLLRILLFAVVILALLIVIAQVIISEIGKELYMESDWLWFYVFFGSQLFGFLVVDTIAILLITCFLFKAKREDRKRQVCLAKCCWQAFIWKSDYQLTIDMTQANR